VRPVSPSTESPFLAGRAAGREAAEGAESGFRALVEATADLIARTAPDGRCRYASPAARALLGCEAAELVGAPWSARIHPEDRAMVAAAAESLRRGEAARQTVTIRYRARHRDGRWVWVEAAQRLAPDDSLDIVEAIRDVGEQMRRDEILRDREAAARRLYALSPVPQHSLDEEGRVTAVTEAWLRLMGYARDDVIGRPFLQLVAPPFRAAARAAWPNLVAGGEIRDFEVELLHKSGEALPVSLGSHVERDAEGRFVRTHGALVDLRARRAAERALEHETAERAEAEEKLRQAQKMEAVGQLTGGVAHDFNNLLTAIIGNLEMLEARTVREEERRLVASAARAADRGARLVQQLLAFSRRQRLEPETVDVNELILRLHDLLERTLGGTVTVGMSLDPELWPAEVDPHQLGLAILNLSINSRDAMEGGGRIVIVTRNAVPRERPTELGAGDFVEVAVTDNGHGMTPDVLARACEPFFTTKGVGKGSGLGLSMVHGFATQSGGGVRIDSRVGEGTAVRVFLPRKVTADAPDRAEPPRADAAQAGVVLVVDDDPDVREVAVAGLRDLGYRVLAAETGDEALDILAAEERVDLLLADYAMPRMNGVELARAARARHPALRIRLMTGHADADAVARSALDLPLLRKPFRLAELAVEVRGALAEPVPGA
jgi:PAS domain S-box-containing protein